MIPNIQLDGRQSKIITTDYRIGDKATLLYSSAEILTYATLDVEVVVFYLNVGQHGVFEFKDAPSDLKFKTYGNTKLQFSRSGNIQYSYSQAEGATAVKFSNGVLVYLLDKSSAWNFFAPPTTPNPSVAPSEHIMVLGPHLVRKASIHHRTVEITGDNVNTTSLEFVPQVFRQIWARSDIKQGIHR